MYLLQIGDNNNALYFFIGIGASILGYFLLRRAVRANDIAKNQEIIIHIMVQQFKKQGATEEEMKKLEEFVMNK